MKRLWIVLAIVVTFGFTVLGWIGSRIYQEMPPIPERIVTSDGRVVVPEGSIRNGQAVRQTLGGALSQRGVILMPGGFHLLQNYGGHHVFTEEAVN